MAKNAVVTIESLLRKRGARYKFRELATLAKLTFKATEQAIAELRKSNKNLVYAKFDKTYFFSEIPTQYSNQTDLSQVMELEGKFGIVSDTHLGSNGERLDILKKAYDTFAERGISQVFHCGDMTDGFHQYRGHHMNVKVYGDAAQAIRVIKSYPRREGITTYVIAGNHDVDHNKEGHTRLSLVVNGVDYEGKHYDGRDDIVFLGDYAHRIILPQEVTMEMLHPVGGASYAVSYKQQKRSEAMERNLRPDIQISGHYHTYNHIWLQGTHFLAIPGMQDETEFFKRLGLPRGMGFVIVHYRIKDARLVSFGPELFMIM